MNRPEEKWAVLSQIHSSVAMAAVLFVRFDPNVIMELVQHINMEKKENRTRVR